MAFDLPQQPLKTSLIQVALKAQVSISTQNLLRCAQQAPAVRGELGLEAVLERLLAGSGCTFRMLDAGSVEIVPIQPPPARAQVAEPVAAPIPSDPLDTVSPIIISATRQPTPADRLAYPVTAVPRASLAGEAIEDAADLALLTPSMTVTNLGPGRDKILLRGLSDGPLTGLTQSMVGLYLDDTRLTYNAPDPDLRMVDVSQVEVLRGPQGALYGAGSLGGVVQVVTAKPSTAERQAWLSTTGGATEGGDPSGNVEGMLNLPISEGSAVRLVGYRDELGGYVDDRALGVQNANRSVQTGWRLSGSLNLPHLWTLSAGLVAQDIETDDSQYVSGGLGAYGRDNRVREPQDNDFRLARVAVGGDLGWAKANWSTALIRHELDSRYDASAAPPVATPGAAITFDDMRAISSLVSEATLVSNPEATRRWLAGLFYSGTRQDSELLLSGANPTVVSFLESRRDRLNEIALFGQASTPLGSRLSLTLGGRVFVLSDRVSSMTSQPISGGGAQFAGGLNHVGLAPKLALAYQFASSSSLYFQAAEGYRSPGFNTTGTVGQVFSPLGGGDPERRYQGDELWSLEAGARLTLLGGRLNLNTAAFQVFWNDIQSDQLLPSGLPYTTNLGRGGNSGVELEGRYRAGALEMAGQLIINSPELESSGAGVSGDRDLALAEVPRASGGVSASYSWSLSAGRSLTLDGRINYVGRSYVVFVGAPPAPMGRFTTGRLAAIFETPRWRATLAVDNPSNSQGNTFSYGNPFTVRTMPQATPLRPRTWSFGVKVSY